MFGHNPQNPAKNQVFRHLNQTLKKWCKPSMGETRFFWCEYIVMYPKNVKTLHEQIISDI